MAKSFIINNPNPITVDPIAIQYPGIQKQYGGALGRVVGGETAPIRPPDSVVTINPIEIPESVVLPPSNPPGIIDSILESIGWTSPPANTIPMNPIDFPEVVQPPAVDPVTPDSPVALPTDNISSYKPQDFVSSNTGKSSSGFVGLFGMPQGKNQSAVSAASPQGIPTQVLLIVVGLLLTIVAISLFRR